MAYNWEIKHEKRSDNVVVDWMSQAISVNVGDIKGGSGNPNEDLQNRIDFGIMNDKLNQIRWEGGEYMGTKLKHTENTDD